MHASVLHDEGCLYPSGKLQDKDWRSTVSQNCQRHSAGMKESS